MLRVNFLVKLLEILKESKKQKHQEQKKPLVFY